jgi:hypothetical protein
MAGDWIKMRSNLWDDPRVAKLCDILDCGEAQIVGALYWLWATADQHTESGLLPGLSLRQIDRKTGVAGFAQALCDVGWLTDDKDGVRISRFEEHNGSSAKKRAVTAKRVANFRGNNDVTPPALPNEDDGVTGALPEGDVTQGALAREREEKSSVSKDTGAEAPDPIFGDGLAYLVRCGVPERGARSFLGKMRKELRDDLVAVELLVKAQQDEVSEPVPWLRAAAKRRIADGRTATGVAL